MLTIRFQPKGRKHRKFYRIVVADKEKHVSKKFKEILGWYNPYSKETSFNQERIDYYVGLNTEISESVKSLLKRNKVIE